MKGFVITESPGFPGSAGSREEPKEQVLQDCGSPPQSGRPARAVRDVARTGCEPSAAPPARATPDWRCSPLHTAGFRGVGRADSRRAALTDPQLAPAARQLGREVGYWEETQM